MTERNLGHDLKVTSLATDTPSVTVVMCVQLGFAMCAVGAFRAARRHGRQVDQTATTDPTSAPVEFRPWLLVRWDDENAPVPCRRDPVARVRTDRRRKDHSQPDGAPLPIR